MLQVMRGLFVTTSLPGCSSTARTFGREEAVSMKRGVLFCACMGVVACTASAGDETVEHSLEPLTVQSTTWYPGSTPSLSYQPGTRCPRP